jgi:hypothetical protein
VPMRDMSCGCGWPARGAMPPPRIDAVPGGRIMPLVPGGGPAACLGLGLGLGLGLRRELQFWC